jgi:iron complex transport system substrate-binding protein
VDASELEDGLYGVEVSSSSSMFRVTDAKLTVADGAMSAVLTLSGDGYLALYSGKGADAPTPPDDTCPHFVEDAEGKYTYTIPVPALNTELDVAAWSIRKEEWYDRVLVFDGNSLTKLEEPESAAVDAIPDGHYTADATLTGGSGKAGIGSPAKVTVSGGVLTAEIVWSSSNYAYMIVDGVKYEPLTLEPGSTFEIPVRLDEEIPIIACTTAMGTPKEIEYTLRFENLALELAYAENFSVTYSADGTAHIAVSDGSEWEFKEAAGNIYLAATSTMCLFDAMDAMDSIRFSSVKSDGWSVPNATAAMERGEIVYAGKYNAPDYELLLNSGCKLAIESTMINHSPEVKEKLTELGISVFTDWSGYEPHPLGRVEWIKLYGVITGRLAEAEQVFDEQLRQADVESEPVSLGKKTAFFYIREDGAAVVRKPGDYVSKMIELAGGDYAFAALNADDSAMGTEAIEMETFYQTAKDADIIIYNSTIAGELNSVADLLAKNAVFADFKSVRDGEVWCVSQDMYQQMASIGTVISELRSVISGSDSGDLTYFTRLK